MTGEALSAVEAATLHGMQHLMMLFVLQLAVVLIAARIVGSLFQRLLRLPRVLGELAAGMLIGPHALGRIPLPEIGPLFALPAGPIPVSPELYALATFASVLLLFIAGLETDLATFIRYSVTGSVVGLSGVIFSFVLGDLCAVWFGLANSFMAPTALFLGTVSTATSVGITARILSDRRKAHTPEGVTLMAAAVLDDVLGIVILAMVVGVSHHAARGGQVPWSDIGFTALKAFGFWLVCTALGLLLARPISRVLKLSHTPATVVTLSLGLALLLAGLSEMVGLAMIIGAYIMGLSLSRTDLVEFLQDRLHGTYELVVPVFFCVMGMLVDFSAVGATLGFGLAFSAVAILTKVAGCGIPAYLTGFNARGALRIGLGMLPRGEVALIVASVGLTAGVIGADFFGIAVLMTAVTTVLAPPLLVQAFRGGPGHDGEGERDSGKPALRLPFPSNDLAEFLFSRILKAFRQEEFFVHRLPMEIPTYQVRKNDITFSIVQQGPDVLLYAVEGQQLVARMVVLEELIAMEDLLESSRNMGNLHDMEEQLAKDLFS